MVDSLLAAISVAPIFILGILEYAMNLIFTHWVITIMIAFYAVIIVSLIEDVTSLRMKINKLENVIGNLNDINSQGYSKIIQQEIENAIEEKFNYSLTNIYNENEMIGHEWTYKIADGHWVTAVFDESKKKFIVKHFRTDENTKINSLEQRMQEDSL